MKTRITILLIVLITTFSYSQSKTINYEAGIRKSLTSFIENLKAKKIDNAVDFIYPKYFKVVSKEQVFTVLNLVYNNPSLIMDIQNFKINTVKKPEFIENTYFSTADYSLNMKFKVDWKTVQNTEEVKQKLHEELAKKYGKENVEYVKNEDHYLINANMKACAVSTDGTDWKFLLLEDNYKQQLMNVLPDAVLEKI
ncbi:hypothetical protein M2347_003245 [Chryseobacterium sp. H1D6B]|uniref:hypothetical protein n=1 Tax=Chryseobacterium sp. H1D6B TaxID=2940588 RepID=UPI0015CEA6A5|nr:hypothetical protein [Chryseobacterium sp. H1D6B]MDH6253518.1 hypothetical protein [Chryseobacterium sp. H1D6B]